LAAKLEEADLAQLSEGLWLVVGILPIQQARERVEARPADQGIVVEVETRILDGYCHRMLNSGLCLLEMRTDRYVI
jgi:hypothetical protein